MVILTPPTLHSYSWEGRSLRPQWSGEDFLSSMLEQVLHEARGSAREQLH